MKALSEHHKRLALHLGGQFAKLIGRRLAEITTAVEGEQRTASFTVTADFKPNKTAEDAYTISLKPRFRTPDMAIEIDLRMVDGQLSLYDRDDVTEAVRDEVANSGNGADRPADDGSHRDGDLDMDGDTSDAEETRASEPQ